MNRSPADLLSAKERTAIAKRMRLVIGHIGTQAQAAEISGSSLRQIKQYLSGQAIPNLVVAERLATAAGYNASWLLTGQATTPRAARALRAERVDAQSVFALLHELRGILIGQRGEPVTNFRRCDYPDHFSPGAYFIVETAEGKRLNPANVKYESDRGVCGVVTITLKPEGA
ncbi:MAG TPA: helix-turn-helix transcriptional regulator [Polyangiaceae bacterium]|nr:helix-turn-helix transcriptional regulator [Polyangiaceae bacterium]